MNRPGPSRWTLLLLLWFPPGLIASCQDSGSTSADSDSEETDCPCGSITDLSTQDLDSNVLSRHVVAQLDRPGGITLTCTLTEAPGRWVQFIPAHTDWQYLDDGSLPAVGWTEPGFEADGWKEGRAPLGYEDERNTELSQEGTSGKASLTAYFRTEFQVDDPELHGDLEISWVKDDGIVLTLNGTEVLRDNLPEGELSQTTEALEKITGSDEDTWNHDTVASSQLRAGMNVLAAEVHQSDQYSHDLSFDARLLAWQQGPEPPPEEVHLLETDTCATTHTLSLHGLLPEATYQCAVQTSCGDTPETFEIRTAQVPEILPRLAIQDQLSNTLSGSYTLFSHSTPCTGDDSNRLVIVDPGGQIRWYWQHPTLSGESTTDIEAELLADGTLLVAGGEHKEGRPILVDLDGEIVYEAGYEELGEHLYHHDVQWQENQILGLVEVQGEEEIEYFGFVRLDPASDTMTWSWDNRDAHAAGTMPRSSNAEMAQDPYHANALAGLTDQDGDGVYVSLLHANVILRIDETSGEMSWVLGEGGDFTLVDPDGALLGEEAWFSGLHAIDVYDDRLWVYDNGWSRSESRALLYTLDTPNLTAELTFSYAEAGWHERVWGDADELPSGNVLIDMGHAWCLGGNESHLGSLAEIDVNTRESIWRLDFLDPDDASYRSQRVDGCDLFHNTRWCP